MVLVCSSVAVLVAMACPDPPQESTAPAPVLNATAAKHAAIIGKPSALQQMLMQQTGASAPQPADQQPGLTPAAGNSMYQVRPAVVSYSGRANYDWKPASPDRPDIFGTSAMPIAHTQLDAKWRRANANAAGAARYSQQVRLAGQTDSAMAKVELVNRWVNRHIKFVNDIRATGKSDIWSGAVETLGRGQGDCEDYAITKLQLLKALGFSSKDLYLSVVKDLVRRADHAVLVVRVDGRFLVLDNNVDRVLDTQEVGDYRPVITYAASGQAWTHGYRLPVQIASADANPAPSAN